LDGLDDWQCECPRETELAGYQSKLSIDLADQSSQRQFDCCHLHWLSLLLFPFAPISSSDGPIDPEMHSSVH